MEPIENSQKNQINLYFKIIDKGFWPCIPFLVFYEWKLSPVLSSKSTIKYYFHKIVDFKLRNVAEKHGKILFTLYSYSVPNSESLSL